jgi:DNA-directed RNA polymerase specialized sigma24 family protein
VVVEHDARDASLTALEEKILMTIATARFRDKLKRDEFEGEIEQDEQEEKDEEDQQVQSGSQDSLPPLLVTPTSGSGKQARFANSVKKTLQVLAPKSNAVQREQELEALSQSAAANYLQNRKLHIQNLQKAGKARVTARKSILRSKLSMISRKSTTRSLAMDDSPKSPERSKDY